MRSGGWAVAAIGVVAAAIVVGMQINDFVDRQRSEAHARAMTGGEPQAGKLALGQAPCGGCHQIPGVAGAVGKVGPSLAGWSGRVYIDGRLRNTPDNLVAWIVDPHAIDPQSAMPATGVTPREARDMAAYLYTLN
jgi:cytochrome c2